MKTKLFLFFLLLIAATQLKANNMLVKNVTTTGDNAANKTIQVQFDLSWDNSWRDAINWDAAWVFMKYKDANGNWQHVQLNTTGFANGTGTANTIQVGSDKVGAFVYRSATGTGTFSSATMQLQWNYGLSGLTNVTGLEIRVFAVEMVYVPQGDFNIARSFYYNGILGTFNAPGDNFPIINSRLTPSLSYSDGTTATIRIKGDAGIDTNNDGVVDNTTYPTGYRAFYSYKYEMSEQQYADFLNTLTATQITALGVAGSGITLINGQYFSSTPYKACGNSTANRLLAYADWAGIRPMSIFEFNKLSYGPLQPVFISQSLCSSAGLNGYPAFGGNSNSFNIRDLVNVGSFSTSNSSRLISGASYYGVLDITGNAHEPVVRTDNFSFNGRNGDGIITSTGQNNVTDWLNININYFDMLKNANCNTGGITYNFLYLSTKHGFRYVRSAE